MSDLNSVCLVGRVTQDAEIQYTAKGIPIYCFSIVNNLTRKMGTELVTVPNYINFRLLGKRWEGLSSWLKQGQIVSVQGRLEQDRWERDGVPRSCLKISVSEMHLLRGKSKKEGEEDAGNSETVPGVPADPEPETPCKEGDQ